MATAVMGSNKSLLRFLDRLTEEGEYKKLPWNKYIIFSTYRHYNMSTSIKNNQGIIFLPN